jgi:hypothetical protein
MSKVTLNIDEVYGVPLHGTPEGAADVNPVPGTGKPLWPHYLANIDDSPIGTVEWPSGANINELLIYCCPHTGVTPTVDTFGMIAIDAVSDATAAAMLTLGSGTSPSRSMQGWIPVPLSNPVTGAISLLRVPLSATLTQGSLGGGRVDVRASTAHALDWWICGS